MTPTFTFRPETDADPRALAEARALVERTPDLETILGAWVGGSRLIVLVSDSAGGVEVWLGVVRDTVGSFVLGREWIASRYGELPALDAEAEGLALDLRNASLGGVYRGEMGMTAFPIPGAMRLALAHALEPDGEARFVGNDPELEDMDRDPDEITDVSTVLFLTHGTTREYVAIPEIRVAPHRPPGA